MRVVMPPLEPYQKDVLNFIKDNPKNKTIVIKSPRQVGKSIFLEVLLVWCSLKSPNSHSICLSPINQQSRKLFMDIVGFAHALIKNANASILEIVFINNSTIKFGSAQQGDNLRGDTVKGSGIVVVDECSYIGEDFFYEVVVPFVNVSHNDIVVASTPKFTQGLFYGLYTQGLTEGSDVKTFDWNSYDLSKFLTPDLLERYRKTMPRMAFEAEYLGKFITGTSMLFQNMGECIGESVLDVKDELVMSIDWGTGTGNDLTVLTTGQVREGKIWVKSSEGFNDKTATETVQFLKETLIHHIQEGYRDITLIVESNSIGTIYYDMLMNAVDEIEKKYGDNWRDPVEITIGKFTTTNKSKNRIIDQLMTVFQNNQIVIPSDRMLLSQLETYECQVKNSGLVTYNASTGFHDDAVMSLAFLVDYCYRYI